MAAGKGSHATAQWFLQWQRSPKVTLGQKNKNTETGALQNGSVGIDKACWIPYVKINDTDQAEKGKNEQKWQKHIQYGPCQPFAFSLSARVESLAQSRAAAFPPPMRLDICPKRNARGKFGW